MSDSLFGVDDIAVDFIRRVQPVMQWPQTRSVLNVTGLAYYATAGTAMRDMPCAHCERPLQGIPYYAFTLIATVPCQSSGSHIPSVTVPVHITCDNGDDQAIADKIVALFARCGD